MDDAGSKIKVDKIVLVEGSARILKVQILISEYVGDKYPSKMIHLDETI